jgi:hypothetical protein
MDLVALIAEETLAASEDNRGDTEARGVTVRASVWVTTLTKAIV